MGLSNKKLGTDFEQEVCTMLARKGWWVHFIAPDARGAQPFDIIAVKAGQAMAIDCKTCVAGSFSINRLEENQIMAFERWILCGNEMPIVMIKHEDKIYAIPYRRIKEEKIVKIKEEFLFE